MKCSLCNSDINDRKTDKQGKIYHICHNCKLIQLDKKFYLSIEAEKQRYQLHENSADNKGYLNYLNSIITNSITPFLKPGKSLFDFGCGPEKTWVDILKGKGYKTSSFDPFFDQNSEWKHSKYDAITSIEVFEHLMFPGKELNNISRCQETGSFLIIRTMLHNDNWEDFTNWWYKDDPTHVAFYSTASFNYICRTWNYNLIQIINNCEIVLQKL